jgi:nitronate monooxygenase
MSNKDFLEGLSLPVIAAPMFLASGPDLVIAACRNGIIGAFPALNQRSTQGYEQWLDAVEAGLQQGPLAGIAALGPHAVNLAVHKSNRRLEADLEVTVRRRVPLVITSLGAAREVIDAVHGYGGRVFHDVVSMRQAEKVLAAGVDGVIAVCAGAGGHAGTLNPFALIHELRQITDKTLVMAGAISTGQQVAAARLAGADLVSIGTRFIGTRESPVVEDYKTLLTRSRAADIVYTPKISGVNANFIAQSIRDNGIDLASVQHEGALDMEAETDSKAWRDIWSAGHGVGAINDIPSVSELLLRMRGEYRQALELATRLLR